MTLLADRYELAEPLGSGGMARVHAAVDHRLGRRVAVKLIREDLLGDAQARARLLREAHNAGAFHHPNSVAVFDVGTDRGTPFIVMELVEGETLADRLKRRGRLDAQETSAIGLATLDALAAAHARGLVHRDVKPANVLLPRTGGVKLADFGIAKEMAASASTITSTNQILGTPTYLAPEQASGESATPASDVYAVGVLLYECLAGRPPFTGDHAMAVALAHQRDPVPPLLRVAPSVPASLAAMVEHALAKTPQRRYPDAAAARDALAWAVEEPAGTATTRVLPAAGEPTQQLDEPIADDAASQETVASRPAASAPGPATRARAAAPTRAMGSAAPRRRRRWPLLLVALVLAGLAGWLALGVMDDLFEDRTDDEAPDAPGEEDPAEDDPGPDDPGPDEPGPGEPGPVEPGPDEPDPDDEPDAPDDEPERDDPGAPDDEPETDAARDTAVEASTEESPAAGDAPDAVDSARVPQAG